MSDVLGAQIVPPRGRKSIRKDTYSLRKQFGFEDQSYFPIMLFLENILPMLDPEFYIEPVEDAELPGRLAETLPEQHVIRVKKTVYDAACKGHPWARKVMAHELAHYKYHNSSDVAYAYLDIGEHVPKECSAEYQADVFAAELLAPVNLICGMGPHAIAQRFGVPVGLAEGQLRQAAHTTRRAGKRKKRPSKSSTADQVHHPFVQQEM